MNNQKRTSGAIEEAIEHRASSFGGKWLRRRLGLMKICKTTMGLYRPKVINDDDISYATIYDCDLLG